MEDVNQALQDIHQELDSLEDVLNSDSKTLPLRKSAPLSVYGASSEKLPLTGEEQNGVSLQAIKALWKKCKLIWGIWFFGIVNVKVSFRMKI